MVLSCYCYNLPCFDGQAEGQGIMVLCVLYFSALYSGVYDVYFIKSTPSTVKTRGGSGVILACFVHMKVLFLLLNCRFLRNENILPNEKVIKIWRSAVARFLYTHIRGTLSKIWCFLSIFWFFCPYFSIFWHFMF